MKNIFKSILSIALLVSSCQKIQNCATPVTPKIHALGHREDDHIKIIIRLYDSQNNPIGNADVLLYIQADSATGITDVTGKTDTIHLDTFGVWQVSISQNGIVLLDTFLQVVDSFSCDSIVIKNYH